MTHAPGQRLVLVLVVIAAFVGCGGGGGQVPSDSPLSVGMATPASNGSPTPTPPMITNVPLALTILIPPGGTTASLIVQLTAVSPTNGATYTGPLNVPTLIVLSPSNSNCTTAPSGYQTCMVTLTVPGPATDTFSISLYATASPVLGTTTPLSVYASLALPIAVGVINTASVVTSGVPVAVLFSPATASVATGFPLKGATALITSMQAIDASGATIIGGGPFATASGAPASVTFTGCDAHLTPTPAALTASNATALGASTISVAFDGTPAAGTTLHCYATATGGLSESVPYTVNVTIGTGGVGFTVSMNRPFSLPESSQTRRRWLRSYN